MNIWNLFELLTMFEELERFPIKAGFSQQASRQICFSVISFNWDPRFWETYTGATLGDLKIKILELVAWAPWAGPFTSWGFLGFAFQHHQADSCHLVSESQTARNVGSVQPFASQATICHPSPFAILLPAICHPRDIFGSICWESLARGDPWEFCMG